MKTMKTKRETIDWLTKSLGAFVALAVVWVVLDLIAGATNIGLLSFFAGITFLLALIAMASVVYVAGSLLLEQ